jgi:hypothetical protein
MHAFLHIQIAPINFFMIGRAIWSQPVNVTLVVARLSGDAASPAAEEPDKPWLEEETWRQT